MTIRPTIQTLVYLCVFALLFYACQNPSNNQEAAENQDTLSMNAQNNNLLTLLVGTYTEGDAAAKDKSEGIYVYEMNPATGELQYKSTAAGIKNPSYLAVHPSNKYVFAASETSGNDTIKTGLVYAYEFDKSSKKLNMINAVSSEGTGPCYVSVHPSGNFAMTANYGSGSVALYPVANTGKLEKASSVDQHQGKGPTDRQKSPHAHMIIPGKNQDFIYAVDLGTDEIVVYKLDADKLVNTNKNTKLPGGAGPRHLDFHPEKDWAYVVNELGGTVTALKLDPSTGSLTTFQTISTLPEGAIEGACADIHVTPSGKYLYASNRGEHNSIAMYAINQETGELTLIGHQATKGETPRGFVIDPSGKFLLVANQNSGNVVTFKIDEATGKLIDTGFETEIPKPVCLKFIE